MKSRVLQYSKVNHRTLFFFWPNSSKAVETMELGTAQPLVRSHPLPLFIDHPSAACAFKKPKPGVFFWAVQQKKKEPSAKRHAREWRECNLYPCLPFSHPPNLSCDDSERLCCPITLRSMQTTNLWGDQSFMYKHEREENTLESCCWTTRQGGRDIRPRKMRDVMQEKEERAWPVCVAILSTKQNARWLWTTAPYCTALYGKLKARPDPKLRLLERGSTSVHCSQVQYIWCLLNGAGTWTIDSIAFSRQKAWMDLAGSLVNTYYFKYLIVRHNGDCRSNVSFL